MKKIIGHPFLVAVVLLCTLCLCSVGILGADDEYMYRVTDDGAVIRLYISDNKEIIIPEAVDNLPIISIDEGAFKKCENLKAITLPSSITQLSKGLFPEGVTVFSTKNSYVEQYCNDNQITFKEYSNAYTSAASVFPDVPENAWYASHVEALYQQKIIAGDDKGKFLPTNNVTRAEFVKMLAVASGDDLSAYQGKSEFSDVSADAWYGKYIAWAADKNLISGYGNGIFKPQGSITRQEMILVQSKYAKEVAKITLPVVGSEITFLDQRDIGAWAKDAVKELQMAGIISGMGNYQLAPAAPSTRAETATMIDFFLILLRSDNKAKEIDGFVYVPSEKTLWDNGKKTTATTAPILKSDILTVPFKAYLQHHGATINSENNQTLTATLADGTILTAQNGSSTVTLSKGTGISLNTPVFIENNEIMVDITAVAAYFNDTVKKSVDGLAYLVYPKNITIDETKWMQGYHSFLANKAVQVTSYTASYGKSGKGRDLAYTVISPTDYTKTMMLVFEQHGFETDSYRDGQALVDAANYLINYYKNSKGTVFNKTRFVIIPSANPDGLAEGTTQNGPGRCTVVGRVDMNRDWPTSNYVPQTKPMFYTLSPLSCSETKNLSTLISTIKPNVLMDFHGWLNGTYGDPQIASIFRNEMGLPYKTLFSTSSLNATNVTYLSDAELENAYLSGLVGFKGYLSGYGYEQGIQSALVEFAGPTKINYQKLLNAINSATKNT